MTENDPQYWATLLQNAWMVVLAIWGGMVAYYQRFRSQREPFSWLVLLGELATCSLTGVLALYACMEMDLSWPMTAIVVALSGHAGGSLLKMADSMLRRRFGLILGSDQNGGDRG